MRFYIYFHFSIYSNLINRQLASIPKSIFNENNAELTHNQLDDLRKKMAPIQQIILSLRPKKKYSIMEYIPDFESYDTDIDINDDHSQSQIVSETYDNDIPDSLTEQIYRKLDGSTTRIYFIIQSFVFSSYKISFQVDQR
jgi:hypothetical protein